MISSTGQSIEDQSCINWGVFVQILVHSFKGSIDRANKVNDKKNYWFRGKSMRFDKYYCNCLFGHI